MNTQKEYRDHNGSECPKCSSTDFKAGEFDLETYNRDCECHSCEFEWTEIYEIKGYEHGAEGAGEIPADEPTFTVKLRKNEQICDKCDHVVDLDNNTHTTNDEGDLLCSDCS